MQCAKILSAVLLLSYSFLATAQDVIVHDPVMIRQDSMYYIFCTGMGITVYSSPDMKNWKKENPVFATPPSWTVAAIPTYKGHAWAPDISYHNGTYYLYYAVSAFGKNTSCIGLATNNTLHPEDKNFKWVDRGKVIQSVPGRDLWNAIDPNLAFDDNGDAWMVFGSFWAGIKLVKMDKSLTGVAQPEEWYTVAKRPRDFKADDYNPGNGAIEAPFIFRKNGYYYLFVSYDYCCRGVNSTYKIMIGRSEHIQGPYVDKDGVKMDEGGASLVLEGNTAWNGLGHNAAYTFKGKDYLIFHAYDAADEGKPKLKIIPLQWDAAGWPLVSFQ